MASSSAHNMDHVTQQQIEGYQAGQQRPPLPRREIYTWKVFANTTEKSRELISAVATLPKFMVLE